MESKDVKWCPQHGYPVPCDKCGYSPQPATLDELKYKLTDLGLWDEQEMRRWQDACSTYEWMHKGFELGIYKADPIIRADERKKIVNWGNETCPHLDILKKHNCRKCWAELQGKSLEEGK